MTTAVANERKTIISDKEADSSTSNRFEGRTILFNDDWHTFDEVAGQLVKATRCTYSKGMALANLVHTTGSAIVYSGPVERCEAVAMILGDIGLKVTVENG